MHLRFQKAFRRLIAPIAELFIAGLRPSHISCRIKSRLLRLQGAAVGDRLFVHQRVWVDFPARLELGCDVVLSRGVLITTGGSVSIGDRVLIGYDAKLISTNHVIPDDPTLPIRFSGHDRAKITIESDAWIGAGAILTAGVTVGEGSVVAAGAVVTKDVEPFTIVGGVPARLIRRRLATDLE